MSAIRRNGFRWTINETLALQREYELLQMSIQEIAVKHDRSVAAILFRLEKEGFVSHQTLARGYQDWVDSCLAEVKRYQDEYHQDAQEDDTGDYGSELDDDVSDLDKLSDRVWTLESSVNDIKDMVSQILTSITPRRYSTSQQKTRSVDL
jgi:hypothetical protein